MFLSPFLIFFVLFLTTVYDVLFMNSVFPSGDVCISILHPPGADPNQYESITERWSPVQSVEKILLSVVSMLSEPNDESPANVDAAKMWRTDKDAYAKRVKRTVELSLNVARQITEKQ